MQQFTHNIAKWIGTTKNAVKALKQNRDLLVFLVFLVLATGLWFLNALRKEYTTTISYPVKYSGFPEDFILLGKPQDRLELKIKSLGYSILPYHMGKLLNPEPLNVSSFKRVKNGNLYGAYMPTRELMKNFSNILPNGVELIQIFPDTLFVYFEKKERKKVPVRFNSELKLKQQYYQSGSITLKPDSVMVAGPSSLVDSIRFVNTEFKVYEALSDSLVRNVSLQHKSNVELSPNRVVVSIPIEPFTEKSLSIPVEHLNIPDTLTLKSFPDDINITFTVAASRFNDIKAKDFTVVVDYKAGSGPGLPDRLKVKLLKQPEDVINVTYSPLFVDCLFEKIVAND